MCNSCVSLYAEPFLLLHIYSFSIYYIPFYHSKHLIQSHPCLKPSTLVKFLLFQCHWFIKQLYVLVNLIQTHPLFHSLTIVDFSLDSCDVLPPPPLYPLGNVFRLGNTLIQNLLVFSFANWPWWCSFNFPFFVLLYL